MGDATTDRVTDRVERVIRETYGAKHPRADVRAYRHCDRAIRVRVLDPDFKGTDIVDRWLALEPIVEGLPDAVRRRITMVLTLTPEEGRESELSAEFDAVRPAGVKPPVANGSVKPKPAGKKPARR